MAIALIIIPADADPVEVDKPFELVPPNDLGFELIRSNFHDNVLGRAPGERLLVEPIEVTEIAYQAILFVMVNACKNAYDDFVRSIIRFSHFFAHRAVERFHDEPGCKRRRSRLYLRLGLGLDCGTLGAANRQHRCYYGNTPAPNDFC